MKTFRERIVWKILRGAIIAVVVSAWAVIAAAPPAQTPAKKKSPVAGPGREGPALPEIGREFTPLFDGRTLRGWKSSMFGGDGDVEIKNGELRLGIGNDLTGVTIDRPIPRSNYEVTLEAQRADGSDFFCGLTFPVKKDPCSLIIGGWGGGVCGLSSIDGFDASENPTTKYRKFKNGQWYAIRLRVTDDKIEAWIDKEPLVDQELKGHTISIRSEVEASKPFGFASYQTLAALRNIRIRRL